MLPFLFLFSCEDEMEVDKYETPSWLEGKVFTVAQSVDELSLFTECIERVGLDLIIDKTGLYTIMAPTNTAVSEYLAANNYSSIDDIDSTELTRLVEIHILLNPWSKDQLRQLNYSGWMDDDNDDLSTLAYKRETTLYPENKEYKVIEVTGDVPVISSTGTSSRIVYSGVHKYVPIFFSEYMDYENVTSSDFEFYYDRAFESSEIYYCGAQLISSDEDLDEDGVIDEFYTAENGYVYLIDQVIEPLESADEFLFDTEGTYQYDSFGDLINEYALFEYNEDATEDQEGYSEGLSVDKLYDISFSGLGFNIFNENTTTTTKYSVCVHNGLFAPTNEAFESFEDNVLGEGKGDEYYGGFSYIPNTLKTLIVNYHMLPDYPYFPSQAGDQGSLYNASDYRVDLSDVNVLETAYGSNSTLVGIDKVLMPDIFPSVAGPVILRPSFSSFFGLIYYTDLFPVLSSLDTEFSLFAIPDEALETDSSLLFTYDDDLFDGFSVTLHKALDQSTGSLVSLSKTSSTGTSLKSLIYGQIAMGVPEGICRKEFLMTLSGYYISFDTETGFVWGGEPTVYGYNGDSVMVLDYNTELSEDFDSYGTAPANGKTYSVDYWMQFPDEYFSKSCLDGDDDYDLFYQLIVDAGLIDSGTGRLNFLTEGESLTIFVPSDQALTAIGAESLSTDELQELIMAHFVTGINMFTDNFIRTPTPDSYFTVDNNLLTIGSSEADKIDIYANDGTINFQVEENDDKTNIMYLGWDNGDDNDGSTLTSKSQVGISVVVHFVDNVIQPDIVF
jgi:uncharacterized surface protein with fasciclin (FAS1) repeats